jgi:GNAT superfamily N-acetyltransferase
MNSQFTRAFRISIRSKLPNSQEFTLAQAVANDAIALADLRVEAMRPSLEALGRFEPDRARNRFLVSYVPKYTWKLVSEGGVVGFFVLRDTDDYLYLDHLYIAEKARGTGLGTSVLEHLKTLAREQNLPVRLMALKHSSANQFYLSQGFTLTGEAEFDNFYEWRSKEVAK